MLNFNRPAPVEDCPRCGEFTLIEPLEINALSRTTRGPNDKSIWVCSDCGTDEGLEDAFLQGAREQEDWPVKERSFQYFLDDILHKERMMDVAFEPAVRASSSKSVVTSDTQKGKATSE